MDNHYKLFKTTTVRPTFIINY